MLSLRILYVTGLILSKNKFALQFMLLYNFFSKTNKISQPQCIFVIRSSEQQDNNVRNTSGIFHPARHWLPSLTFTTT